MNIYFFTIITSHYSEDNIDVQIYSSNYHIAFEMLVAEYGHRYSLENMFYNFKSNTASPLQWIGTAK